MASLLLNLPSTPTSRKTGDLVLGGRGQGGSEIKPSEQMLLRDILR